MKTFETILNVTQKIVTILCAILYIYLTIDYSIDYFKHDIQPTNFQLMVLLVLSVSIITTLNQKQ